MYYFVIVQTNEKLTKSDDYRTYIQYDSTDLESIKQNVVRPFLENIDLHFEGNFIKKSDIKHISIKESPKPIATLQEEAYEKLPQGFFVVLTSETIVREKNGLTDITNSVFNSVRASISTKIPTNTGNKNDIFSSKRVFIVHGRDNLAKTETARLIEALGLDAVVLHEQINSGKTIIEKIEQETDCGFAIVLYTPCDLGRISSEVDEQPRARQNVIFEHGYLTAKLGRDRVCALKKENIETPSDISGVVYTNMDSEGMWKYAVARELQAVGFIIDMNKVR
ncbi:TIR domain-containing protein [Acetobacter orleanensis]|uniref:CD-NTase-associated protein 12/Pycsar effector protein TIR domain-containing protein n=1 Tax=Acetobacter orleanensis TaxID=104099 RepID=A0A4Y3TNR5_9PROT|nr:nucleotide-binding protein [Acetobacter orleanensis]KXV66645.1 hypothetical protein AD949_01900 [Acetobacter orleanensis]PCD78206.1 DNA-binding protein [Acetobacter orleanensis]GAN69866.1 nucleic acid-binding protein [Acetobacter orleanensis JCM 7639]GBR21960.1 putative nucleotide-binding protein containing TIR-like domain [Acetobacter orleanensis NRIC 0473]GEB83986.1 hypothetical protein AOR01nite_24630 [Acetobacter orleanensis]